MTTITCLLCGKTLEPVVTDETFYEEMGEMGTGTISP